MGNPRYIKVAEQIKVIVAELLERRLAGEPVAYLIGEWEFYGLGLDITRNHDDKDIQRFATDGLQNLIAVETWHVQIQEQQLTFSCSEELQSLLTIAGGQHFTRETRRQTSNELLTGEAGIITNNNGIGHAVPLNRQ